MERERESLIRKVEWKRSEGSRVTGGMKVPSIQRVANPASVISDGIPIPSQAVHRFDDKRATKRAVAVSKRQPNGLTGLCGMETRAIRLSRLRIMRKASMHHRVQ